MGTKLASHQSGFEGLTNLRNGTHGPWVSLAVSGLKMVPGLPGLLLRMMLWRLTMRSFCFARLLLEVIFRCGCQFNRKVVDHQHNTDCNGKCLLSHVIPMEVSSMK